MCALSESNALRVSSYCRPILGHLTASLYYPVRASPFSNHPILPGGNSFKLKVGPPSTTPCFPSCTPPPPGAPPPALLLLPRLLLWLPSPLPSSAAATASLLFSRYEVPPPLMMLLLVLLVVMWLVGKGCGDGSSKGELSEFKDVVFVPGYQATPA